MFKNLSKYRHVYCDAPKQEACHVGLRLSTVSGEQQHVKASARYFSVALAGGAVYVGRHDRPGRYATGTTPVLRGHRGEVLDFEWSPFDDATLATAGEDTRIRVWRIPEEWEPIDGRGASDRSGGDITESAGNLDGHDLRVNLLRFHPTASNVLASTSYDRTVKLWDVEAEKEFSTLPLAAPGGAPDVCQDIAWDYKGNNYAVSCKDRMVKFVDARAGKVSMQVNAHNGGKCTKVVYLGTDSNKALTTGHSSTANRVVKVWDLRKKKCLHQETLDSASGALLPLYDIDADVVYLCGKGDGNVRVFSVDDERPHFRQLNEGFRSAAPLKGACLVPKRGLDVMRCETARLLKVANNAGKGEPGVQPLSFVVPRRSAGFQADLFPETASSVPAHAGREWWKGSSKRPILQSLDPAMEGEVPAEEVDSMDMAFDDEPYELDQPTSIEALREKIEYLEWKLDQAGISYYKPKKTTQQSTSPPSLEVKSSSRRGSLMGFKRKLSRGFSRESSERKL